MLDTQESSISTQSADLLQKLCQHIGIDPGYWDPWGQWQNIPEDAQRAVLAAMNFGVADDRQLQDSLAQVQKMAQQWPALWVLRQVYGSAIELDISQDMLMSDLHLQPHAPLLQWTLNTETGERYAGAAQHQTLTRGAHQGKWGWSVDLPKNLPWGYHDFQVTLEKDSTNPVWKTRLAICPTACYAPQALRHGERWWGLAVQLYAVQSLSNWGIGDFADLRQVVTLAARQGAQFVGLNPLHALFSSDPGRTSMMSSRL